MAKLSSVLSICLCLCLVLLGGCLARRPEQKQLNECQLERLNALEPDHRVESEAGVTESWNANHPDLRCAGVTVVRRTINPKGLHLPSYSNAAQMHFIVQGRGVLGLSIPGCAETFEEPQSQSRQQHQDRHQKLRHIEEGDIVAIPAGIPYWTYNNEDSPLVAITLLDTTNSENQLDRNPRRFYLAGNPKEEHPETQEGRKQGKPQQQEGNNLFSGFETRLLAQALNIDEETARKLQSQNDRRNQIVRVKGGLSIISPPFQREQQEDEEGEEEEDIEQQQERQGRGDKAGRGREEEEEEGEEKEQGQRGKGQRQRGQRHRQEEEEEEEQGQRGQGQRRRQGQRGQGQQEEEEEEEQEQRGQGERRRQEQRRPSQQEEGQRGQGQRRRQGQRQEDEEEEQQRQPREGQRRQGQGSGNALEETVCSLRIHQNIGHPSRADFYNPRAGRISTINSLDLPILKWLQLSAERVFLYRNGMYAPHWNINANSIVYVTRGSGRVQIVDCRGNSVFNGKLRKGQLLVVPQNFAVAEQAGSEGFEYIVFKTNGMAMVSQMVGRTSFASATPSEVLANAFRLRPQQVSALKYARDEGPLVSPASESQESFIVKA